MTAAEQALLRRLCVFAGRFTVDDAEAVCAYGEATAGQALDVLSALVDKSLVMKEDVRGVACLPAARDHARVRQPEVAGRRRGGRFSRRGTSSTTGSGVAMPRVTRGIERWSGSSGLSWRSTTSARSCRGAWRPRTGDAGSRSPPPSATTGSRAAPPRACAGSMNSSPLLETKRTSPRGPTHFRGWLGMLQIEPEAARPWLARADRGGPSDGAGLAVVRVTVDGLDGGAHGGRWRGWLDGFLTKPRPWRRALIRTPRRSG